MKRFFLLICGLFLCIAGMATPLMTLEKAMIDPVETKKVKITPDGVTLKPDSRLSLKFDGEQLSNQGTVILAFVPDELFGVDKKGKHPDILLQMGNMHWQPNSLSMVREPDNRIILTFFGEKTRTFGEFAGGVIRKGEINTAAVAWNGDEVLFFLNANGPMVRKSPLPIRLGKDRFTLGAPLLDPEKRSPNWNFAGKIVDLLVDDTMLSREEIFALTQKMRAGKPATVLKQGAIRAGFNGNGGISELVLAADGRETALPVDPDQFWMVQIGNKQFSSGNSRFLEGKIETTSDETRYVTRHELDKGNYTLEMRYAVRASEGDRLRVSYAITRKSKEDAVLRVFISRIYGFPPAKEARGVQAYRSGQLWRGDKLPGYTSRPAPGHMWMQFSGYYGPAGAALFYAEDNRGFLKFNFHGRNKTGIFFGWYEDALLKGTEHYTIPYDYVIMPFASADYHDFTRVYGEWARQQSWAQVKAVDKLAARPQLAKFIFNGIIKVCGFEGMGTSSYIPYEVKQKTCRLSLTYDKAMEYMAKFEALYGVQPGYRFDGWYGPHDVGYPDLLPVADRIGGMEGLQRFFDFTNRHKMPVTYYVNPANFDEDAPSYRITKSVRGYKMEPNPFSLWNGSRLRWVSPKFMIEDNLPVLTKLHEMGLCGGIFFDQLGGSSPYIDMNDHAGYEYYGRDSNHQGQRAAFKAFRTTFPDFILGTEDGQEQMMDSFDYSENYARGVLDSGECIEVDGYTWVPLVELVYGDCYFNLMGIDGNSILTADRRRVVRALFATSQGCSMREELEYLPVRHAEFERNDVIGEFATKRMLSHRIDPKGWRASVYENGAVIGNTDGQLCDAAIETPIGRIEVRGMRPAGFVILTANGKFVLWGVKELFHDGKLLASVDNPDSIIVKNCRGILMASYGFVGTANRSEPYASFSKEPWTVKLPGVDFKVLSLKTFPSPEQPYAARVEGDTIRFDAPGAEKSLWLR